MSRDVSQPNSLSQGTEEVTSLTTAVCDATSLTTARDAASLAAAAAARDCKRTKVFRHVLNRTNSDHNNARSSVVVERRQTFMTAGPSPAATTTATADVFRNETTPTPALSFQLYSHANPPLSLSLRGGSSAKNNGSGGDMLPADYREPVATLPPIQAAVGPPGVGGPRQVVAGGPDLMDLVGFPLGRSSRSGGGHQQRSSVEGENTQQDSYA